MKNKITFFIFLGLILLSVPVDASADRFLTTRVITDSNSTFAFSLSNFVIGHWFSSGFFSITTDNLIGTGPIKNILDNPPEYPPSQYRLEETVPLDFKLNKIDCYCDSGYHPSGVFSYSGNSVYIYPQSATSPYCSQNLYCDFYNTKIKIPVLIVPGIAGTEMRDGNGLLWPNIDRMFLDAGDNFLDPLIFNQNLTPSDSNIFASDVIKTGELFGATVYNYTDKLINEFAGKGYVENQNLFTFPYDWRYGVSGKNANDKTNSDLLGEKISQILAQTGANKVDVIAHSMGGLIAKKYVADVAASASSGEPSKVGKAVFVGVPNTGAPKAVKALIQGDNFGISFGPIGLSDSEMKKLSENMPAVYDLLPSQKYYDIAGSFVSQVNYISNPTDPWQKDLNYQEFENYLIQEKKLNQLGLDNAQALHSQTFDDFDMRSAGVDLYAIDGCKTGTMTNFLEVKYKNIFGNTFTSYDRVDLKTGDGTVPIQSSTNLPIDQNKKYYVLTGDHSKLMSQDGSRQKIVNLVLGTNIPVDSNLVTQNVNECQLNGKVIEVFSPVDISVTDQNGNTMVLVDGNITNQIPNADFEIWGEHKFVYLPQDPGGAPGQTYAINMQGTGAGTYTINTQDIVGGEVAKVEIFKDLPVTPALAGQINLSAGGTTLSLNNSPDPILPTETIDYAADKTAPEVVVQFDAINKNIKFSGIDNLSPSQFVSVKDSGTLLTLKDEAGNTSEFGIKKTGRRAATSLEITSVKYNGVAATIGRNSMSYSWSLDGAGNLAKLTQKISLRNSYTVSAIYDGVKTKITGTDSSGKISQSLPGLVILKVTTNNGNLTWSY